MNDFNLELHNDLIINVRDVFGGSLKKVEKFPTEQIQKFAKLLPNETTVLLIVVKNDNSYSKVSAAIGFLGISVKVKKVVFEDINTLVLYTEKPLSADDKSRFFKEFTRSTYNNNEFSTTKTENTLF